MAVPSIPQLPPGVTMAMLQNIAAFFNNQPVERSRPSGKLPANMIRGVNPRYQHQHQEYPKALNTPDVEVNDERHERSLRAQWQQPLPWEDRVDPASQKNLVTEYYAYQKYPKVLVPPQTIVNSAEEEDAQLAEWRTANPGRAVYPRWMFHYQLPAVLVDNLSQDTKLGDGWYPSPAEAIEAYNAQHASDVGSVEGEHAQLIEEAKALGLKATSAWSVKRLKDAIVSVNKKAA